MNQYTVHTYIVCINKYLSICVNEGGFCYKGSVRDDPGGVSVT